MMKQNPTAAVTGANDTTAHIAKNDSRDGNRPTTLISGIALVMLGLGGVFLAPLVGAFLYQNHYRLPGALQDEIYPELYGLEIYEAQFLNWALWPASVLVFLGFFLLLFHLLPTRLRDWLASRNGEVALWAIAALGVTLRLRALLEQRSLWLDESFIAVNLRDRGLIDLLSIPLAYGQSAPPGFLIVIWLSYTLFGPSEIALRLTPFLFGVATVVLAKFASTKLFHSTVARLAFLGIVSFSPVLVYYSQELKQYSIDAFATVVAIWMLVNWGAQRNRWLFGLIGAVLVQFSLGSVFTLIALGLAILVRYIRRAGLWNGSVSMLREHFRTFLFWLAGGLIHGWYLIVAGTDTQGMRNWWVSVGGFPPQDQSVLVSWLIESFQKIIWLALGHNSVASIDVNAPDTLVAVLLFMVAVGLLFSTTGRVFSLTLLALTIVLGFLQVYPYFVGRLHLYLVPVIALILAGLVSRLAELPKKAIAWPLSRLVAGTALIPLFISLIIFGRPEDKQDMRWLINEYELGQESGDILTTPDELIYGWYESALKLDHPNYVEQSEVIDNPASLSSETIWIISTHYPAAPIIEALAETHRLECEANPRFTRLHILIPIDAPQSSEYFCEIRVPKL